MESKQALCDRILEDAARDCADSERSAQEKKEKTVAEARKIADALLAEENKKLNADKENVIQKKRTLVALEKRKTVLGCRQEIVGSVYGKVAEKLAAMPEGEYLAFIDGLISANGEKGDTVIFSASAPFTLGAVQALPSVKRLGLNVRGDGNFSGGIILSGSSYDKKLTFDALVADLREKTETETADKLFGKQE